MRRLTTIVLVLLATANSLGGEQSAREQAFREPPESARPWAYWFWINGNISQEGITADLEAFQRAGIGGVLWMEVSGPWWAPDGTVAANSPQWHAAMQWAIRECERLGLEFDLTLDFGYGSGGPHITPELSMQELVWSETVVLGGQTIDIVLPASQYKLSGSQIFPPDPTLDVLLKKGDREEKTVAWLRPGAQLNQAVVQAIERSDSYRDVAVIGMPRPLSQAARDYRIDELQAKAGLDWRLKETPGVEPPPDAVVPLEQVVDLTGKMDDAGRLTWEAPPGEWLIFRYGHDTNLKLTRPCPAVAVGLECDRLAKSGVESHFDGFLAKILQDAGPLAGKSLSFAHIDSWEAGYQNWTASFPAEFRARRGYDLTVWLPVLSGRVVGSAELSERFLWDVRQTVSELICDNYAGRLSELIRPYGLQLSLEGYGHLCVDSLSYAGISDLPISEFWARGTNRFPDSLAGGFTPSSKAMASAAHAYGRPVIGAEAFTSDRGWQDHPFLLKGMGDQMFCEGVNRMIFSLAAHQPYDSLIPGLTHRRWGEHINRYNTWWNYARPWMEYLARCQYLLQQGRFVADVCYWPGEGAPLSVYDMDLTLPAGYDYDQCSTELLLQLQIRDGQLELPSGMRYRYLLLASTDRLTLPVARKVEQLVQDGARVISPRRPRGSPSLADYPQGDLEIERIAASLWESGRVVSGQTMAEVLGADGLQPDFVGPGLQYIHRHAEDLDFYFVANPKNQLREVACTFRVSGKVPELWDPETGRIYAATQFAATDDRTTVDLRFEPLQSWFVVFRPGDQQADVGSPWSALHTLRPIAGPWQVTFEPRWGGPPRPAEFSELLDWSQHPDDAIKYYSGTASYRLSFDLSPSELSPADQRLWLDLGQVEVMARVTLNDVDCGVAWKPPYRVEITPAARSGENQLQIDVVNLWINRMIGDERLPADSHWKDYETLIEWPAWFANGQANPTGRRTFTTCRHYRADSPLSASGLLGPVTLQWSSR